MSPSPVIHTIECHESSLKPREILGLFVYFRTPAKALQMSTLVPSTKVDVFVCKLPKTLPSRSAAAGNSADNYCFPAGKFIRRPARKRKGGPRLTIGVRATW